MSLSPSEPLLAPTPGDAWDATRVVRALDAARSALWEDPSRARVTAVHCQEIARTLGDDGLRARALAVQGAITLYRGDMRGTFSLAAEAERYAESAREATALLEVAALKAQLSFFAGSYTEALREASLALDLADRTGDPTLRIFARRAACLVMGNLDAPGWRAELDELIRLTVEAGDRWQEAISRNDLAHWLMTRDDFAGAERELARGIALADELAPANALALAVLHCTRSELRLRMGDPHDGLAEADRALGLLAAFDEPNPYLFGMTVKLEVQALLALDRPDEAQRSGARAVERLGDRLPQARSMILESVATALREAGRVDEAYEALARGAELERRALQELIELQLGFERATLETKAARRTADALAQKNRELEHVVDELAGAHAELQERTTELEGLQEQLRDQADRDPLTGLHNRRYLTSALHRLAREPASAPVSVAILDIDNFKAVNDAFGHAAGDRVLIRVAVLLRAVMRTSDTLTRTGGEEFVVLMPRTGAGAAQAVCERLLQVLRDETWHRIDERLTVTASVGVATGDPAAAAPLDFEALTRLADERLYLAKHAGRNRVVGDGSGATA